MANMTPPPAGPNTPEARAGREAYWRDMVRRWEESGLDKTAFCAREGITTASFHWWIRDLRRRDGGKVRTRSPKPKKVGPARLVPAQVVKAAKSGPTPAPIEVVVLGQVIRVIPDFDPETFRRVVAVLQGWPLAGEPPETLPC